MISYGRHSISTEDIEAVVAVLKSDFLTQGPVAVAFECAIAEYVGAKYAVACDNGTSALHLACKALGVVTGDIGWTVPNSFVASANCIRYCGATVDFVDIDESTLNISVDALEEKLTHAEKTGKLPKVLVVVHFAGSSCDMKRIAALAKRYGFYVIEDAAHALGATYTDSKVGACTYSDITTFSFHPVKSITTGEGGMATTNSALLENKMRLLASHGISRSGEGIDLTAQGAWYYELQELGFNARMSDIHAALGLSQLQRIDNFISTRREIASNYETLLLSDKLSFQAVSENAKSARHLFVILIEGLTHTSKIKLFEVFAGRGVKLQCHYIPIPSHPYYARLGFDMKSWPVASSVYEKAVSLPIFYGLEREQQVMVCDTLIEFVRNELD